MGGWTKGHGWPWSAPARAAGRPERLHRCNLQGPYFPLLELQARWIVHTWTSVGAGPHDVPARAGIVSPPTVVDSHNAFAVALAAAAGVAPDVRSRPDLAEPLRLGPMLPPRYRLDGPVARPDAARTFRDQLAASPRAPVEPDDIAALMELGYGDLLPGLDPVGAPARS